MKKNNLNELPENTIKERIIKLRKLAGYTQAFVAAEVYLPQNTYSKYEQSTNGNTPSAETIILLSQLYEVTTDYLLTGKKESVSELASELFRKIPESKQEKILNIIKEILLL